MHRTMIWLETQVLMGWGCSECAWTFNPSGELKGESLDAVIRDFISQRDKEFRAYACDFHEAVKSSVLKIRSAF